MEATPTSKRVKAAWAENQENQNKVKEGNMATKKKTDGKEKVKAAPAKETKKSAKVSRRGTIITLFKQQGTWTISDLAKKLEEMNKAWPAAKNKAAIKGTLADLKKNNSWAVKVDKAGLVSVSAK